MSKQNLNVQRIISAGAQRLGHFENGNFKFVTGKSKDDARAKGFYFIVSAGVVKARTFVGDQETNRGFNETIYRVCHGFQPLTDEIWSKSYSLNQVVYFMPLHLAPSLLKSPAQLELFGENMAKAQTLTAVSRQLFKVYNFEYQKR
ncbi:ndd [Aeromonas phage 31]|uniref:Ndd n=2 Tax=Biquartavirus TaxID=1912143 RepID=Q56EC3_9CAUD|nr:Ndd-like nucleoid disruption protein [Aeromonas phage 31]APU01131.1 nucleoid disruption protein [Aeromonas phage 31.2]APU02042.1 nucleoid disruption protein [Aeromonas phage L9-6]APU02293.1 nucleoid disruption protein [Aeromonas phage Riv-10]APU02541.1 nucleoid disruption protein [Aeromonas phage SW69-9]UYD59551.1 hypothetical protein JNMOADIG_00022 [Aeromonas phage avDM5]UYD60475.1 hypothetical protein NPHMPGLK_00140 [Aeromonas phage avDM2]